MAAVTARLLAALAVCAGLLAAPAPAGSEPADGAPPAPVHSAPTPVPGIDAPGYEARYLVAPNPLSSTEGMALDGTGGLYICKALHNGLVRLDLATGDLTVIAAESDADPLQIPDDIAIGPDGDLFVTNMLALNVMRLSPDGKERRVVARNLGDGRSLTNAIAFNASDRLFATDLSFADPSYPGGLWEIDPEGVRPPVPVVRGLAAPNGFDFGPDGLAYIPEMFGGRVIAVDVDARTVRTVADGFGNPVSLALDPDGRLVVLETDTGRVWRVDRQSGERTVLAQGDPGLDNVVVFPDGRIWVSSFVQGNVRQVDEESGALVPVLPQGSLTLPFSLDEAADGSLVFGDFTAVSVRRGETARRLTRLLVSDLQLLTPGAAAVGDGIYASDFLPPDGRLVRIDPATGARRVVATGFGFPWTVREGIGGHLLVGDQALGAVFDVDPATGTTTPVVGGLASPSGLRVDRAAGVAYVSDTGGGRVLSVDLASRAVSVLATGLRGPEGIGIDRDGTVLVVEGDAGRLLRLRPGGGPPEVVATGLSTRTVGLGLPLMNYSADVLVRADGSIVVTGNADASLLELRR